MDKDAKRRAEQGSRLTEIRKAAGFRSARAAALEFGWPESTYRAHEGGTRTIGLDDAERYSGGFRKRGAKVTSQTILYAAADPTAGTGGFLAAAQAEASSAPPVIRPAGPEPTEVEPADNAPTLSQLGDFDVEVRGISVGGSDDEFYFNGEVIDHIRRPPGIKRAKNVFALNVSGDSMMPRYEPGEPIYVQRANPAVGDYVVVELYPEDEGHAGKSFLKQLVRRTGRRVTCSQFNPPKEVEFDAGEVKEIFRVLKPRELLG
ncbi:S24 family peptidase [Tardiphaga sp.]|uniref:S24 family peptidase n=1 Tax=Tardiphaga sp. TaxID=1926292 RepID=UPI00261D7CBC|nr:S24 family peptidase [Tardiphaga sp.]MDB5617059.1 putative phage repressor [Tardiphaga sp.]